MEKLEIKILKIEELTPYENNAKLHPDEQIDQIVESIKEFGFNDPISIWKDGIIIEGHGRLLAAKKLGIKEVPVIDLSFLTDQQRKAYTLVHNQTTMNSGFDLNILNMELKNIEFDLSKYDFKLPEIPIDDIQEDEPPELDEENEPIAKIGDIYQLGKHRLMCGSSTSAEDVQNLLQGASIDLCVTDPPYNVNYGSINESKYGRQRVQGNKILNDNMDDKSFFNFLLDFYTQMLKALKPGGAFYIFHADSEGLNFRSALHEAGAEVKQNLIWVKNAFVMGRQDYQWQHEPILYGWKEGAAHYFTEDRTQATVLEDFDRNFSKMKKSELVKFLEDIFTEETPTTIIRENKPLRNDLHPTMKPVKLLAKLIQNSSKTKESVLDLFGGSGSTLMACEQTDRACYMMELEPKYIDVIIKRWENFTGKKAIKIA